MNKVVKNITKGVLVILFLYGIFYAAFNLIKPNLTVQFLGWKPYVVLSDSMKPVLNKGDLVIATWTDPDYLRKDDIVIVTPNKQIGVIHYLAGTEIDRGRVYIRTRRYDAVSAEDWDYWRVSRDEYIGKANIIIPWVGNIILFLLSPYGLGLLIIAVAGVLIYRKKVRKNG